MWFFFNDTATAELYTLPLHDALPICRYRRSGRSLHAPPAVDSVEAGRRRAPSRADARSAAQAQPLPRGLRRRRGPDRVVTRSEEHTSELQSRQYLVCRLLLEKKKRSS